MRWLDTQQDCVGEPRESKLVLVLTRKIKQSIMIGDDIEITVLSNDGAKVRLGIQAPSTIPVHRVEIYDEIQAKREGASSERHDLSRARGGRAG